MALPTHAGPVLPPAPIAPGELRSHVARRRWGRRAPLTGAGQKTWTVQFTHRLNKTTITALPVEWVTVVV